LINAKQLIVAHYLYDPYGSVLSQSGPLGDANLYRFSSKEFHAASALVCYLYRLYEPDSQRWLNGDPVGELGFESVRSGHALPVVLGANLYAFVRNDPIRRIDLFGLADLNTDPTCMMLRALANLMMQVDPNISWAIKSLYDTQGYPDNPIRRPVPPGEERYRPRFDPSVNRQWECIKGGPRVPVQPPSVFFPDWWDEIGPFGRTAVGAAGAAGAATAGTWILVGGASSAPIWVWVLAPAL
jgi:RHS repeat-associated protein